MKNRISMLVVTVMILVFMSPASAVAQTEPLVVICEETEEMLEALITMRNALLENRSEFLRIHQESRMQSLPDAPDGYRRHLDEFEKALLEEAKAVTQAIKEINILIRQGQQVKTTVCA